MNPLWKSFSRALAVGVATISFPACSLMQPAPTENTSKAELLKPPARLTSAELDAAGLEELWYNPPEAAAQRDARDGGVQNVFPLDDGLLIVTKPGKAGGDRLLKLYRRGDGFPVWDQPVDGPITETPTAYHYPDTRVVPELYYAVYDTIHCLDLRHGALLWSREVEAPISSPVIATDSHYIFGSANGRIYGHKKSTGVMDWQYRTGEAVASAPALQDGKVVFGSNDGHVYGLVPARGWVSFQSWDVPTGSRVEAGIETFARWFFAGSTDYKLYCLENDGSIYWTFGAEAPITEAPVVYRHRPNDEYAFTLAGKPSDASKTLFAVPLPKAQVAPVGVAKWRRKDVRSVLSMGKDTVYVLDAAGPDGEQTISGLDVETGEQRVALRVDDFAFFPQNSADNGRDAGERSRIYLVGRDGSMQCVAEKKPRG